MLIRTLALFVVAAPSFAALQSAPVPAAPSRAHAPQRAQVYSVAPSTVDPTQGQARAAQPKHESQTHGQTPSQTPGAWIGISLIDNDEGGPNVGQVVGGSPAEHAGFQPGDRVVAIDDTRVADTDAVIGHVGHLRPGTEIDVQVRRTISVALESEHKSTAGAFVLGVELGSARKVGDDEGVEIKNSLSGWPASSAGVQAGDVLLTVEGKRVASSAHVSNVLKSIEEPREVRVEVARKIHVTLGSQPHNLAPKLALPRQPRSVPATPTPVAPPPPQAPRGTGRWTLTPQTENNDALLDEVRALSRELRELREQIAALRGSLSQQAHR